MDDSKVSSKNTDSKISKKQSKVDKYLSSMHSNNDSFESEDISEKEPSFVKFEPVP